VSEETGAVSLAIKGNLERGLSPEALRARLRSLLGLQRRSRLLRRDAAKETA